MYRTLGIKAGWISTFKWIIISALMIMPAVLSFFFIKEYGVNVPVFDQWVETPELFDKLYSGLLSFNDLFGPYWEHRPFLGRLVVLSLGFITRYNNVAEMYSSWFILCITLLLLLSIYVKYFGATQIALMRFIPVAWLIFSLRQWESLLRGDTFAWFMTLLFFILTVYLLETSRDAGWRFAFAAISSLACTFTHAVGLTVWFIGLALIILNWRAHDRAFGRLYMTMALIWCLVATLVFIAYFSGFSMQPGTESHYYKDQPLNAINFIFIAIGSPLALDIYMAAAAGILLSILYAYSIVYIINNNLVSRPVARISLALILFTLFTVVLLVPSRSGIGLERAMLSRYTTFTALGITGLYLLILQLDQKRNNIKQILSGSMLALLITGLIAVDSRAIAVDGKAARDAGNKAAYYVANFETQRDEDLAGLCYGHLGFVKDGAAVLKKYQLNIFSPPSWDINKIVFDGLAILKNYWAHAFHPAPLNTANLTLLEGSSFYSVDLINSRQSTTQESYFTINSLSEKIVTIDGWAIDQPAGKVAGGVFISIDGKKDVAANYGIKRADVADYYKNDNYRYSGFTVSFDSTLLKPGTHLLSLKIVNADKKGYYETGKFVINVN